MAGLKQEIDAFSSSLKTASDFKADEFLNGASCDVCSSLNVVNFCESCKQWMCGSCSSFHSKLSATATHTLTPASTRAGVVFKGLTDAMDDTRRLKERREQQKRVETSLEQLMELHEKCRKELDAEFSRKAKQILATFPRYDESRAMLEKIASQLKRLNTAVASDVKMTQKLQQVSEVSSELHKLAKTELSTWNNGPDEPLPVVQRNRDWTCKFVFWKDAAPKTVRRNEIVLKKAPQSTAAPKAKT